MRKLSVIFAALFLCLLCHTASAANIKDFPRVAVMNFGNKAVMSAGLRTTDFSAATEYAIYQLSACGWFDLVDYEQLSTIAKIHSVNMSGLVDPATAVAVGKFAGAQFMVVGNLTGLTTKENVVGYQHGNKGGFGANEHVVTANVSMRIVDIETGRIIVAGLGKGSSTSTKMEVVFKKYRNSGNHVSSGSSSPYDTARNDLYPSDAYGTSGVSSYDGGQSGIYGSYAAGSGGAQASADIPDIGEPINNGAQGGASDSDGTGNNASISYGEGGSDFPSDEMGQENAEPAGTADPYGTSGGFSDSGYGGQSDSYYDAEEYKIVIGTAHVSDIQVRNAISKAIRDCIYGNMGLMTTLNGGKKLNIKTGF
ncbi:MAG: hypothetical protein IJ741_03860 [Schwartzia sp.]|nr:hypothetical protein [Schwartzia sp. (in: firmicutes)]